MIWPIWSDGDARTLKMLERARTEDGPDREAMQETHGMVSIDRAPHQALRRHFGLAYSVASWESGRVEWADSADAECVK